MRFGVQVDVGKLSLGSYAEYLFWCMFFGVSYANSALNLILSGAGKQVASIKRKAIQQ